MEELDFKCGKCDVQFVLTEDYYCPVCKKLFCFSHIDSHGCSVELIAPKYITGTWKVKKLKEANQEENYLLRIRPIKRNIANTQYFSYETKVCSQCKLTKQISEMFRNKTTGEYWCMYCVAIEKKKRNAKRWEKKLEPDIKTKSKEKEIFGTWDEICLNKLNEIGKATLTEWATAMGYKNSGSMVKPAQNLEEQGKIRVIRNKSGKIKKYYEAI